MDQYIYVATLAYEEEENESYLATTIDSSSIQYGFITATGLPHQLLDVIYFQCNNQSPSP